MPRQTCARASLLSCFQCARRKSRCRRLAPSLAMSKPFQDANVKIYFGIAQMAPPATPFLMQKTAHSPQDAPYFQQTCAPGPCSRRAWIPVHLSMPLPVRAALTPTQPLQSAQLLRITLYICDLQILNIKLIVKYVAKHPPSCQSTAPIKNDFGYQL